ncbi:MAG: polysaccharide deacetylase family protein [Conexivisphaerales archaeon]
MLQFKSSVKKSVLSFALSQNPLAFRTAKKLAMRLMKLQYEPNDSEPKRAFCCISVDFDVTRPERARANERGTSSLIMLAERYDLPVTWAVCGRTVEEYPDQFNKITSSTSKKEIAVHTYSHLDVSAATEYELLEDFERFKKAVGDSKYSTFIFPWNRVAHLDTLRNLGFIAYRGKERRIGNAATNEGLLNIAPVIYTGAETYQQSFLPRTLLELCIKTGSIFHLWTHPWDVVFPSPQEYRDKVLDPIFSLMSDYQKSGLLKPMTMGELATHISQNTEASKKSVQEFKAN